MVIYMDDHRKKLVARLMRIAKLRGLRRDQELLCANWNPAFGAIAMSCYQTPQELSPELPDEHARVQPAFMNRINALATQI